MAPKGTRPVVLAGLLRRGWLRAKSPLSAKLLSSLQVSPAFQAAFTWEEHELRERYLYKDRAVRGPHFEIA